mmetsp:Transcript_6693/g.8753  ORF Transcript_6693/g.8753 Transcript_6693/m.8753 type:complete len:147 (+) Transcript_6693:673-1113(+)
MLSRVDPSVVDSVIAMVESHFTGLLGERGKKLIFLCMEIDLFDKGKFKLGTVQYSKEMIKELEEILEDYGEGLDRKHASPTVKWLFTVKPDIKLISEDKGDAYRKFVAKLLWVMNFLLTRILIYYTSSKRSNTTSVTSHIIVHCMC